MTTNEGIRIKSSIESLRGLIDEVKEGRFRLPAFQRSFTWRNDQIADLFDSVARDYPIGSLYVWSTTGDHVTSDAIGPFIQPPRKPGSLVNLVIDGQHRIATLVGVLLADDKAEDRWRLFYDPDTERFCHIPAGRNGEAHWVPVKSLANMLGVLAESRRLMNIDPENSTIWIQRLERVARSITEYQIPVIGYSGDLSSAIEIFARLNQKGKTMGPDELLSALTYREDGAQGFRLSDQINSLLDDIESTGFGRLNRTFALRAILAAADLDIYSRNWNGLAKDLKNSEKKTQDLLVNAVKEANRGLLAAVKLLDSQGIYSIRQLSYGMQLVALSAFLGVNPEPDLSQREMLLQMLWVSSFTAWFGPPAQERLLIRELRSLASSGKSLQRLNSIDLDSPALPMPSHIDQRSARVRALVNVVVSQGPRRTDGSSLGKEVGPLLLAREGNPLTRIFTRGPKDLLASPANRVIAVTSEGGAARSWLCSIDPEHRDSVLRSLAIPPEAFRFLETNDAENFLQARLAYLDYLEREFMRSKGVTEPKPGAKPAPSPIDTDD
jgi:hypothetical protein